MFEDAVGVPREVVAVDVGVAQSAAAVDSGNLKERKREKEDNEK